ncbi:MAG TPA: sulfatase-like hydrolase/transferase [Erysipelothrix sp.]
MKKPNIVFILADDLGPWALNCYGNQDMISPHIDKLAAEGMQFNNFFCTSPVCSPARASLLTGKIPSQHGIHDWICDENETQAEIEYLENQIAYTDILAEHGYRCGLSGKWHVGKSSKVQKGFDHFFAHKSGGGPYYNAPFYRNGVFEVVEEYVTEAITKDALDFIDESVAQNKPFYLSVGYTAPHSPWLNNHPKAYTDLYEDCEFTSIPKEARHPDSIYLTDEVNKDLKANLIGYFAATTAMDQGVKDIMSRLEKHGIKEDTLVIFTADNGFSCGHNGFWGKGNGTFPINMYDNSIKVPFIASHPGVIPQNTQTNAMVSAYDFFPSILDYVGIKYELDDTYPGKSFKDVLLKQEKTQHQAVCIYDEYGPNRMIRTDRFKFIKRYPYGPDALFDLKNDPQEQHNLIASYEDLDSELVTSLREELEAWFFKYVNPEIDGIHEAVYGSGQINKAGRWSKGKVSQNKPDFKINQ